MSETTINTAPNNKLLDKTDWVGFWTCFLGSFGVYLYTLAPTVSLEDSGELAVAADYLGVPHPPGYPIWTLTSWFFQWIFHWVKYNGYPNPAWGVAFSSAFFGALAIGITGMLISKSSGNLLLALGKTKRSFNRDLLHPGIGLCIALALAVFYKVLGSGAGNKLTAIFFLYLIIAFALGFFNQKKYKGFCAPDTAGSMFFGFLVGLLLICSFWSKNKIAMFFSVGLALAIPLLDFLLALAQRRMKEEDNENHSWLRWGASVAGALIFAFSPVMWSQSTIVEVYSLNAFFMAIILLLTYLWMCKPENNKLLYTCAFLFGLGLTNHQSLLFLLLFLLAAIAARDRKLFKDAVGVIFFVSSILCFFKANQYGAATGSNPADIQAQGFFIGLGLFLLTLTIVMAFMKGYLLTQWKKLLLIALFIVLGLSFHGYMPMAAEQNPPMNWGYPRTQQGFKHALFRGQYEKITMKDNFSKIVNQFKGVDGNGNPIRGNEQQVRQRRFFFFDQLGAYFYNPSKDSLFSMVRMFSVPLSIIGLIPLLVLWRMGIGNRTWISAMGIAFFSLSVIFLIAQYPQLNYQDLFIKRVQYIQAHGVYAVWIAYGLVVLLFILKNLLSPLPLEKIGAIAMAILVPAVPLWKNAYDQRFIDLAGCCEMNGHDFGWQFGYYQLKGAKGIMEELDPNEPPLPNPAYPPEMGTNAVFFGGTDPGRFVPTYMIYSAHVRPDVYLITQNALADNTYMNIMRDLYGNQIWIPSQVDSNEAFRKYVDDVKSGRIKAGAEVSTEGGKVSVQGVGGVMAINGILCKNIHEHNKARHDFYIEESYTIPWMYPYLTPHGLIMKLNPEPIKLSDEMVKNDTEFWDWYTARLLRNNKFHRDVIARKTFSKLRSAIGGLYDYHNRRKAAEHALKQAVELYPLSPEANTKLANVYMKTRKFDEAIGLLDAFLEKDPKYSAVSNMRKKIKQISGLDNTRKKLEEKRKKNPLSVQEAFQLMGAYISLGQMQQAEAIARSIYSNPQMPPNILMQLSQTLERVSRFKVAHQATIKYIEKKPKDPKGYIQQAALYIKQKKYTDAIQSVNLAVKSNKPNAQKALRNDKRFEALRSYPAFRKLVPPSKNSFNFMGNGLTSP